jgi:hypothetical protein
MQERAGLVIPEIRKRCDFLRVLEEGGEREALRRAKKRLKSSIG